ncbi:PAS domain S-box protein [Marinibaculum pumilum]|uniref:histidine kinase n=1 Tax=Marinibaculum pumilum TaxID=1766165 RepID=A0ABV7L804_9PROT
MTDRTTPENAAPAKRQPARFALQRALAMLALGLSYAMAAQLAVTNLAIPPTDVVPIWPAAAVALVGLLAGGMALWPGLAGGGLLFFAIHYGIGDFSLAELTTIAGHVAAPVLQAVLAAALARQHWQRLSAGDHRAAPGFLLRGGPLACIVAPSLSVPLLVWNGQIPGDDAITTWLLWWSGDSLGVVLGAPLAMLLLPPARNAWHGRRLQIVLPLAGTCALVAVAMSWAVHVDWRLAHEERALNAAGAFDSANAELLTAVDTAAATAHHLAFSEGEADAEFRQFASRVLPPRLSALAWVPRTTQNAQAPGAPAGSLPQETFPVTELVAQRELEGMVGLDISAWPHWAAALARARRSGRPVATAAGDATAGAPPYVLVLAPVYSDGLTPSVEARLGTGLRGFVAAVLDPAQFAEATAGLAARHRLVIQVNDVSPAGVTTALAQGGSAAPAGNRPAIWEHDINLPGRIWRLRALTADGAHMFGESLVSRIFLTLCIATALLIAIYVLNSAGNRRADGLAVQRRTSELADAHRRLERAMNLAQVVDWELDVGSGEFVLNDRYYAMMGTKVEQVGGYRLAIRDWLRMFAHPEDRDRIAALFNIPRHDTKDLAIDQCEFRQLRIDGSVCDIAARFEMRRDGDGQVVRVIGTAQDISALRRAERARRESDEFNRSIFESSKECIKVLDLDGRLVDMNPQGREVMEVRDFENIRHAEWVSLWLHEEDRAQVRFALEEARQGRSTRFNGQTPTFAGTPKVWDVIVSPVLGADGRVARILGVSRDVTAEHEARASIQELNSKLEREVEERTRELADSEHQLRAIFDSAAVGIIFADPRGQLLRANPKFYEILGYARTELAGAMPDTAIHPDDLAIHERQIERVTRGEIQSYTQEERFIRKDGETTWVRVNGSVIRGADGEVLYRLAMVEDIADAKRDRERLDASERRYRQLFDGNPMPMWTYDVTTLAFTSVNQAAIDHYGYSREAFLRMTLKDIRPPEDLPRLQGALQELEPGFHSVRNMRHILRSGRVIDVDITSHDVGESLKGQRLVLANDVTERRRADALVAGQREALEAVVRGASLRDTLDYLVRILERWTPGLQCAVMLHDRRSACLDPVSAPSLPARMVGGLRGTPVAEGIALCGTAAWRNADIVRTAVDAPPPGGEAGIRHGFHGAFSLPIRDPDGEVLGTFDGYCRAPGEVAEGSLDIARTLIHTAAIAITKQQEREARMESEARFRAIFESSPIGIVLAAPDGMILAANPRQCDMLGVREDEFVGTYGLRDYTHPDDIDRDMAHFEQVAAGELSSYAIEKQALRKDGTGLWVSVSGSVVRDPDGNPRYAVRMIKDITDRINNERALRESEERYRTTFQLAGLGIWHIGANGFATVNPHLCQMTGYDEAELLAMAPDDLAFDGEPLLDPAQVAALQEGTLASFSVERRYRRRDGAPIWTNATISLVHGEDPGQAYLLGIVEDVTRRRAAKEKLHQQEEVNRLLLENLAEGVVACDGDGELMLFNRAARDWHGTDPLRIPKEQWSEYYDLYEADGRTRLAVDRIPLMRAFQGQTFANAEMSIARRGFPARQVLASGAPLYNAEGEKRGAVVVMHDVTEQRAAMLQLQKAAEELKAANATVEHERTSLATRVAERTTELTTTNAELVRAKEAAEAASRAKSTFLATVSHEIRTPMNGVMGAIELLERSGLEPSQAKLLRTAGSCSRSLLALLNDLLDMAKIEAGRIQLTPVPTSMAEVVAEVVTIHRPNAGEKGVAIRSEIGAAVPDWLSVDDLRLKQILNNFLSNAVKFTASGRIDVDVDSEVLQGSRHRLRFTVRDTGTGIDSRSLAVLFRPFEQGTAEFARRSGGTGLGLAISRGLAERMNGSVTLESTPGAGTTATLFLEANECGADWHAHDPGPAWEGDIVEEFVARRAPGTKAPVLVVDDHPVNRDVIVRQLNQLGIEALAVANGVEAMERLRNGRFSLVITDCEMPQMDGYALAQAIRTEMPDMAGTGIVACTAHALPEVAERCYAAGIDVVLTKPVDLAGLAGTLQRWWPVGALPHPADARAEAEPEALTATSPLDMDHLALISGGDPQVVTEILEDFLATFQAGLEELEHAVAAADLPACRAAAHKSKGACLTIGAGPLAHAISALHDRAREGSDPTALAEALTAIRFEARRLDSLQQGRIAGARALPGDQARGAA